MATTGFSLGRDCQLVLVGPFGRVDLTHVTGFDSRQNTHSVRVSRMDGVQMAAELPQGWEGNFELERGSSSIDDFFAQIEAAWHAGKKLDASTLYQYVQESDGSTSTFQYDGVVFRLVAAGKWRGDDGVKQKLEFFAGRRRRI